jgi:hypothetical protein
MIDLRPVLRPFSSTEIEHLQSPVKARSQRNHTDLTSESPDDDELQQSN